MLSPNKTDEAALRSGPSTPRSALPPLTDGPRLYQEIARRISAMIVDERYGDGDRLPGERELALRLGVSRASTREAVIALEVVGIVEVRTGSGIYVRMPGPPGSARLSEFLAGDPGPGPHEALEMRRLLEGEAAFRAATRIGASEIAALQACIATMRDDPAPVPWRGDAGDRAFHELIAVASGNSILAMMVRQLWDTRALPLWRRWMERTRTASMHLDRVAEHERIAACLAAADASGAQAAMHHHLDQVSQRFAQE